MSKKGKVERPVPPMVTYGVGIDPTTMRPVSHQEEIEREQKFKKQQIQEEIDRAERELAHGMMTVIKLTDPKGEENMVLRAIVARLEQRVEELMEPDPECKSLIAILQAVGYHVKAGPEIAMKVLETHLGSEVRKSIMGAAL